MFRRKSPLPPKLNTNDATAFPELSSKKVSQHNQTMNFAAMAAKNAEVAPITEVIAKPKLTAKDDTSAVIMGRLVELYETWKKNYIETWGEEDYERNYRFPNYDYEYFDKLDELYEAALLKEEAEAQEKEAEEEFTTDGPEYEEYLQDE
jgi:hypothetical protein